jgi:hypothetical protein
MPSLLLIVLQGREVLALNRREERATDFTMPLGLRLEPRAHSKLVGFGQVCHAQDKIAHMDNIQRQANRVKQVMCTRQMLDTQLAEIQKQRVW